MIALPENAIAPSAASRGSGQRHCALRDRHEVRNAMTIRHWSSPAWFQCGLEQAVDQMPGSGWPARCRRGTIPHPCSCLRQFQLDRLDALLRTAIVARDVAALEATVDDEAVVGLRLEHADQSIAQGRAATVAAGRAEIEIRKATLEQERARHFGSSGLPRARSDHARHGCARARRPAPGDRDASTARRAPRSRRPSVPRPSR